MDEVAFASAGDLARRIRAREIGCVEALDLMLGRVARFDGAINAIVVRDDERARARAAAADAELARGNGVGPLHGVPMTVKECFQLTGTPTTYGLPAYRDNVAVKNAVAVDRLLHAGANVFGKTNVPPWLADGQSANPIYGRTNNPWDLNRTPGGSSGGSAAVVASGMGYLELGSDIASSIRNPAHYCGVYGHKTTWGIASPYGKSLAASTPADDISVIGPFARTAGDLELALSIIAGPDDDAPSRFPFALPPETRTQFKEFRVAMIYDDPVAEVDAEVSDQLRALAAFLRGAGASVTEARPAIDSWDAYRVFLLLLRAVGAHRANDDEYARLLERAATVDRTVIDMPTMQLRALTISHREWLQLNLERRAMQDRWRSFFTEYDIVLCPPLSTAALPHMPDAPAQRVVPVNGKPAPYSRQLFWGGYTGVVYLPATVAPIGRTPSGLPVGVQIVGPAYHDLRCIRFAQLLEQQYRAFEPPPGY